MVQSSEGLLVDIREDGVCVLTLNRPEQSNGVNLPLHLRLQSVWEELALDARVRAVIVTGAGETFCAGGDFNRMLDNSQDPTAPASMMRRARELITEMVRFPAPIIAAINGPAVGLGANLAILTDIILIADSAYIADPHIRIGLACGDGGAAVWPAVMSLPAAKRYLLTGDKIPADEAYRIGLASEVCSPGDLMPKALTLAGRLAKQPVRALQDTKRAINTHLERQLVGALDVAAFAEQATLASPEYAEIVRKLAARAEGTGQTDQSTSVAR
ncbi:enoyl-CoA hydratase [Mycolicibacterium anyangense]|uniref:Enoyl-CoA hydratase n=1 Tax=Mycolicibacterium anyangense TaxID=1431246 RepID=A0A6N4WD60_9MYCO|nr:enoyl-CoA hydratase/isomerase family protein [Mycolicibacterium anyangense]BBZ77131.1 enoyl-CoA hydratase [Mycolicibacterium anyangense]